MLFSHLPAGYISTYASQKFWLRKLNKKQVIFLFILGSLLGLLPDIDILYYYFINAELSHRELITHSPFLYLLGAFILFIIGLAFRSNFIKSFSFLFFLSPLIHLILDTTTAGIPLFYPFSNKLYGLLMIPALDNGLYGDYIYVFLYGLELLIILLFINLLIFQFIHKQIIKNVGVILSLLIFVAFLIFMINLNFSLYPKNSLRYYGDIDNDGTINMRDADIDGDSIINIEDDDADDDGIHNRDEIIREINKMKGLYYDYTEEGYYNFLSRFGFLSSTDLVLKSYDAAGIFLGNEMKIDCERNKEFYDSAPEDDGFNQNYNNIYAYFNNNNYIINNLSELESGDLIFWGFTDQISAISIISKITEENIFVLKGIRKSKKIEEVAISSIDDFGNIVNYGKIIK